MPEFAGLWSEQSKGGNEGGRRLKLTKLEMKMMEEARKKQKENIVQPQVVVVVVVVVMVARVITTVLSFPLLLLLLLILLLPKVVWGRTFKGAAFISEPSCIEIKDFDVGKSYARTFTLTNVSFTFNAFKILDLPDAGLRFQNQTLNPFLFQPQPILLSHNPSQSKISSLSNTRLPARYQRA